MINWLIQQSVILTLLVCVLLLTRKLCNKYLGVKSGYTLWSLIPISFALNGLWFYLKPTISSDVYRYKVAINQAIDLTIKQNYFSAIDISIMLWATGLVSLVIGIVCIHFEQIKSLELKAMDQSALITTVDLPLRLAVKTSNKIESPLLIGLLNPSLVLPNNFSELFDQQQQQMILEHELMHYKNNDVMWNSLAIFLLCIFWFNPLFWFAYKYFRQQQELACDHAVLENKSNSSRKSYAYAMINASISKDATFITQLNYSEEIHMKERVIYVGKHKLNKKLPMVLIAGLLGSALGMGQMVMAGQNQPTKVSPVHREAPKYPVSAVQDKIEGYVQLSFNIETDGSVSGAKVIESKPVGVFDQSALTAIKKWKYNRPIEKLTKVQVQLDFAMDKTSDVHPKFKGTEIIKVRSEQ